MPILLTSPHRLIIRDTAFEDREILKRVDALWDRDERCWYLPFAVEDCSILRKVEYLFDKLGGIEVSSSAQECLRQIESKKQEIELTRKMVDANAPISLKVDGLKVSLRNYQKLGVKFALTNQTGVLIADDTGIGKTIQSIVISLVMKHRGLAENCLVVAPASLKWNWPIEIAKFTDEKYVVIHGSPEERIKQWQSDAFFYIVNYELITEDLFGGKTFKLDQGDEESKQRRKKTMTKAQLRARALQPVRERVWGLIVADEIHFAQGHHSKRTTHLKALRAKYRIGLSGTPLDGRLEHLHSVMQFIYPHLFPSLFKFLQRYGVTDYWGKVVRYKNVEQVKQKIRPFYIRRLKKDVLPELPEKIYLNRFVELSTAESKIYKELAHQGHIITEDAEAMVRVIRCKQFCDHPILIGETIEGSKMQTFLEVLGEAVMQNGHKALVFSQYKEMVKVLVEKFDSMGIKYLCITGDTPTKERAEMQEKFNTDTTIDLMVGTDAMASGLNFQGADVIFNFDDPWSPSTISQREGRSLRIGQKNSVTVVNFVVKDTIEERIRKVLESKSRVSADVMGDNIDEIAIKRLGITEIARLL